MEILNIEGVSFPVAKYEILRFYHYGDNYRDKFYAPADMKFFKVKSYESESEFEGKMYHPEFYYGITEWSKEKEKITHNFSVDVNGEEVFECPVKNSHSLFVHNLMNRYLIWELSDVGILDDCFPVTEEVYRFPEPIYLERKKIKDLKLSEKEIDINDLVKTFQYMKLNGIDKSGEGYDVIRVTVDLSSPYMDLEVMQIDRDIVQFLDMIPFGDSEVVDESTKEIFEKAFNETFEKIKK